ncbi:MAG: cupin domain-containing protein [Gammaproteobacteria bacterium]|nr:cupin domain-containing protein [Gammaproteobacteria bacterium]
MQINSHFNPGEFLTDYWQKQHLVVKNAFTLNRDLITADELAGLACDENMQSRLILTDSAQSNWTCDYGPFNEQALTNLPATLWTLLVQAVDEYIPEMQDLRDAFDFIPKWRLDDVMVSAANTGGGVGPHFDYYDVFLVQLSGTREWKIGQACNSRSTLREHTDLKLLENFNTQDTHILKQGDLLYIPAGLAHWGTAMSDDCITASIGFRAPSYRELVIGALENLAEQFKQDQRYRDRDLTPNQDPYLISASVSQELDSIWQHIDKNALIQNLEKEFSRQVTEVRDPDLFSFKNYSVEEIKELIDADRLHLSKHPSARFAYLQQNENTTLYVNGIDYSTNLESALFSCHNDVSKLQNVDLELIAELLNEGFLLLQKP